MLCPPSQLLLVTPASTDSSSLAVGSIERMWANDKSPSGITLTPGPPDRCQSQGTLHQGPNLTVQQNSPVTWNLQSKGICQSLQLAKIKNDPSKNFGCWCLFLWHLQQLVQHLCLAKANLMCIEILQEKITWEKPTFKGKFGERSASPTLWSCYSCGLAQCSTASPKSGLSNSVSKQIKSQPAAKSSFLF